MEIVKNCFRIKKTSETNMNPQIKYNEEKPIKSPNVEVQVEKELTSTPPSKKFDEYNLPTIV